MKFKTFKKYIDINTTIFINDTNIKYLNVKEKKNNKDYDNLEVIGFYAIGKNKIVIYTND